MRRHRRGRGPRECTERKLEEPTWDVVWLFSVRGGVVGAADRCENPSDEGVWVVSRDRRPDGLVRAGAKTESSTYQATVFAEWWCVITARSSACRWQGGGPSRMTALRRRKHLSAEWHRLPRVSTTHPFLHYLPLILGRGTQSASVSLSMSSFDSNLLIFNTPGRPIQHRLAREPPVSDFASLARRRIERPQGLGLD